MLVDAEDQVLEVFEVGDFMRLLVGELSDHLARAGTRHLPGVHGLQRAAARARARNGIDAIGTATVHASCSSSCAISRTTSAASSPLLPWLPPARASAS